MPPTDAETGAMTATSRAITPESLLSLEAYARVRAQWQAEVGAHRRLRRVALGGPVWLQFENERTVRHQIQEMLRAERQFEPEAIADEIAGCRALLPDGTDWRAALLIGLPSTADGSVAGLADWTGLAGAVRAAVDGQPPVVPSVDDDLAADDRARPATVHFLRFGLDAAFRQAVRAGAPVHLSVQHPQLQTRMALSAQMLQSLIADWD